MKNILNDINKDYKFLSSLTKDIPSKKKDLWESRLLEWIKKLVTGEEIDPEKISKFRGTSALLSETPRNPYLNTIVRKHIYKYLRFSGYKKTCFHIFEKLRYNDDLMWETFSEVGQPIYYECDGKKFNERFLRHLRTIFIVEKHVNLQNDAIVVDIGGGYGQFLTMLNYKYSSTKKILVDFPEMLLIASYFIKKTFPNIKINSIRNCYDQNVSIYEMLKLNDFLLIPTDQVHILDDVRADLVCNFSSLGEMPIKNFQSYINSRLINNTKYFFTINRLDSFPTYKNNISILDYDLNRFKPIHFQVSPIWDFYFRSFSPFLIRKHAFKSRNFEFLGKLDQ